MKPFVKWAGGKRKLIPEIKKYLPSKIKRYWEPFVGGGALLFDLAQSDHFSEAFINDLNPELMRTYLIVKCSVEELILELKKLEKKYYNSDPEKLFYSIRAQDVTELYDLELAARFIFLNKTCFNGLYRVNKSGQFNAPWGKYEKPTICDEEGLRLASKALKKVDFSQKDFEEALLQIAPGDVVYFDPPYIPLNPTSNFTNYTPNGFNLPEQERLANLFKSLSDKGVHCVLSNSDTELTRKLYEDFPMHQIKAARAINSVASKRGKISELIITSL